MKLYILEMPVDRCIDCRNVISCITTGDNTWRCREVLDREHKQSEFRVIPKENLNGDFPAWCPLNDITNDEWIARIMKGRKDKAVTYGGPI
jgi:hypothetical protein